MKAIAVQAVFLIAVTAIFLLFIAGIFSGWVKITESTVSEATCRAAKIGFCSAIKSKITPTERWNSDCSQFNIYEPKLPEDCS